MLVFITKLVRFVSEKGFLWLRWYRICLQCRSGFDPWVGKTHWEENGYPLQYSYLENPMDRGDWRATVAKSQMQLKWFSLHTHIPSSNLFMSSDLLLRTWGLRDLPRVGWLLRVSMEQCHLVSFKSLVPTLGRIMMSSKEKLAHIHKYQGREMFLILIYK